MCKRLLIKIIFLVALIFAISAGIFFYSIKDKYVVPILMYHSVDTVTESRNKLKITVQTFRKQMQFLKAHKYNILPLNKLVLLIKEKKIIPKNTVVITFDDGMENNFIFAYPVIKEFKIPVTIFLIVDEIGKFERLTLTQIKEMQDSGLVNFGSHSLGPEPLVNIKSDEEIKRQIFDSRKILEDKLGVKVNLFSYPEGFFNDKIKKMVIDAGYIGAVATIPGLGFANDDIFVLKRLRISESAKNMVNFYGQISGYYMIFKERHKERKEKRNAKK